MFDTIKNKKQSSAALIALAYKSDVRQPWLQLMSTGRSFLLTAFMANCHAIVTVS